MYKFSKKIDLLLVFRQHRQMKELCSQNKIFISKISTIVFHNIPQCRYIKAGLTVPLLFSASFKSEKLSPFSPSKDEIALWVHFECSMAVGWQFFLSLFVKIQCPIVASSLRNAHILIERLGTPASAALILGCLWDRNVLTCLIPIFRFLILHLLEKMMF